MSHDDLLVINGKCPEIECLKSKMRSFCILASLNNWTFDEGICISFKKYNHLLMNDPQVKCDAMDTILDIDMTNVDLDMFGVHVADFLFHFLIHDIGTNYDCAIFVYCPVMIEKLIDMGGMRPISQEVMLTGGQYAGTFDYPAFLHGLSENITDGHKLGSFLANQKDILSKSLARKNKLFVKNRGFIVMDVSVEKSWYNAFEIMYAIETHARLGPVVFSENVIIPAFEVQADVTKFEFDGTMDQLSVNRQSDTPLFEDGELEFGAMMRYLECLNLRVDYGYKTRSIWKKVLKC